MRKRAPRPTLRPAAGLAALILGCCALLPVIAEEMELFDPHTGYRVSRYRAPVTLDAPGAARIGFDDVSALVRDQRAILVDVMAAEGGGPDPRTGEWRLTKPRQNIPGSHWLPDVGKGILNSGMESYFRSNLQRLTEGDKGRPIIIYCLADCWMGWNAARRAASWGYTAVHWYPEGTDGWRDWDGTLAPAAPVAMSPADVARCVPTRFPSTDTGSSMP